MEHFNIKLETPRLYLVPLTYAQLLAYPNPQSNVESELGILPGGRIISEEFKLTIQNYLIPYLNHNPLHHLYATIWAIIFKEEKRLVGDIGFNAAPTEKGVIEVGYSTYSTFQNLGIMTEALGAISQWAFDQPKVKIIIAQTDKDNFSSHKVLAKNGFEQFAEADRFYWWRRDKETAEDS